MGSRPRLKHSGVTFFRGNDSTALFRDSFSGSVRPARGDDQALDVALAFAPQVRFLDADELETRAGERIAHVPLGVHVATVRSDAVARPRSAFAERVLEREDQHPARPQRGVRSGERLREIAEVVQRVRRSDDVERRRRGAQERRELGRGRLVVQRAGGRRLEPLGREVDAAETAGVGPPVRGECGQRISLSTVCRPPLSCRKCACRCRHQICGSSASS
jgi:hypothetical protein